MTTSSEPVEGDIAENIDEADKGNDEGDTSSSSIGDSTLDGREDCSTTDPHNQDTGTTASVASKVGSAESEDGWVHGRLEEIDDDQDTDRDVSGNGADDSVQGNGDDSVNHEEEVRLENSSQTSSDETATSEGDESVGEQVGGLSGSEGSILSGVVDEERANGDLSTDVAELRDEPEDHVVLLVERTLANLVAELISSEVLDGARVEHLLRDLGKLGNQEEDGNRNTGTGNGEVDELDVDQVVGVLATEEELGGNQRTNKARYTIPALTKLKACRG